MISRLDCFTLGRKPCQKEPSPASPPKLTDNPGAEYRTDIVLLDLRPEWNPSEDGKGSIVVLFKPGFLEQRRRLAADLCAGLLTSVLRAAGKNTYRDLVNALWERQPAYSRYDIELVEPPPALPDPGESPLVARIFAAYEKAKHDQLLRDPVFQPHGGWKRVVTSAYAELIESCEEGDLERFHLFLSNF